MLGGIDVARLAHQPQEMGVARHEPRPGSQEGHHGGVGIMPADTDRVVERGDAAGAEISRLLFGELA